MKKATLKFKPHNKPFYRPLHEVEYDEPPPDPTDWRAMGELRYRMVYPQRQPLWVDTSGESDGDLILNLTFYIVTHEEFLKDWDVFDPDLFSWELMIGEFVKFGDILEYWHRSQVELVRLFE